MKRFFRDSIYRMIVCATLGMTIFSCSPAADTEYNLSSTTNYVQAVEAGNFAPGQLEAHYQKHQNEFRSITQEEYLEGARALLNAVPGGKILGKTRANGDILRYRTDTGEFAVMRSDGRIRTYFKTDYPYWTRQ